MTFIAFSAHTRMSGVDIAGAQAANRAARSARAPPMP